MSIYKIVGRKSVLYTEEIVPTFLISDLILVDFHNFRPQNINLKNTFMAKNYKNVGKDSFLYKRCYFINIEGLLMSFEGEIMVRR